MPSHTRFGMWEDNTQLLSIPLLESNLLSRKMFAIPPTHFSEWSPACGINFLKSSCFSCHEGGVLQVYSVVRI
jgi:hypothetical protein